MNIAQPQIPGPDKRLLRIAIIAAVVIYIVLSVAGCSNVQKTMQKVLTNEFAFKKVGGEFARLHPCVVDSVINFVNDAAFKKDTAYVFLPVINSLVKRECMIP